MDGAEVGAFTSNTGAIEVSDKTVVVEMDSIPGPASSCVAFCWFFFKSKS